MPASGQPRAVKRVKAESVSESFPLALLGLSNRAGFPDRPLDAVPLCSRVPRRGRLADDLGIVVRVSWPSDLYHAGSGKINRSSLSPTQPPAGTPCPEYLMCQAC